MSGAPVDSPTRAAGARIVVGVDGSPHSAAALRWTLRQAQLTGAWVDAVACWHVPAMVGLNPDPVSFVDLDQTGLTESTAQAAVAHAVRVTPGAARVEVRTRVEQGYPAAVLLDAAEGADLLVVGSRGHGELTGMLLGSVGLHCATHAHCPVVIVHRTDDPPPAPMTA